MTTAYILFKVRKELDHYQANTWKLLTGYFDEERAKRFRDGCNLGLSMSEQRTGWVCEYQEVDIIDLPKEIEDALSKLQSRTEE